MKRRILTTHGKLVYIVFGAIAVSLLSVTGAVLIGGIGGQNAGSASRDGGGVAAAGSVVAVLAFWAWIVVGARLFRGDDEPVDPPRAWWRLTAKPTAGFVIAGLLGVQVLGAVVTAWVAGLATDAGVRSDVVTAGVAASGAATSGAAAFAAAVAAVAYLHSSIRLRAEEPDPRRADLP